MPKLQDFTGQKIDKLLVLEKAKSRSGHVYSENYTKAYNVLIGEKED